MERENKSTRSHSQIPVDRLLAVDVAATLDGATVVVDLRDGVSIARVIPEATRISPSELDSWATKERDAGRLLLDQRIVVTAPEDGVARLGAESLRDLGFIRAGFLDGGLPEWVRLQATRPSSSDEVDNEKEEEQ